MPAPDRLTLARRLADLYTAFPQVEAIALSGSLASGATTDPASDLDLYIYTSALIPLDDRISVISRAGGASRADLNLDYWDLGDEWFHAPTGIEVDLVYWDTGWIWEYLARVVEQHQPSLGFTTAHWHTIRRSQPFFDRSGWFARLQDWCDRPYPEALRQAIIRRNHSLLRQVIPAYAHQIEKAVRRGDGISVHQRISDLLNSYFDILFAFNRVLHPGEKRLLQQAARLCARLPENMETEVMAVLQSAARVDASTIAAVERLLDHLDVLLAEDGFTPGGG